MMQFVTFHTVPPTFRAPGDSSYFWRLSSLMVSVNAGQGDECLYLELLEKRSWSHFAHTYFPTERERVH